MAWIVPAARKTPTPLGLQNGRLSPCLNTPNCASSQATMKSNLVAPIKYTCDRQTAFQTVVSIINLNSKATLRAQTDNYLHAEYVALFFIDDVEFYFPNEESVIHVRSASRVGRYDLGANKRRLKSISAAFSSRQ